MPGTIRFICLLMLGLAAYSQAAIYNIGTISSDYTHSGTINGTNSASYMFTAGRSCTVTVSTGVSITSGIVGAIWDQANPGDKKGFFVSRTYDLVSGHRYAINLSCSMTTINYTLKIDFPEPTKTLSSVSISGNSTIANGSSYTYSATAYFSDGTSSTVTSSAYWSLSSTFYASLSGSTVTNNNSTSSAKSVTLTASYTYNGTTKSATKSISLGGVSGKTLSSISISGNSTIAYGSNYTYSATAYFSDGTSSTVTSLATWSLSSTSYASLSGSRVTNNNSTSSARSVTLTASYTYNGTTKSATKTISLGGVSGKTLSSVSISGNSTIADGSNCTYSATAYFSDGTSSIVTSSATWSLSSTSYASLSGSTVTNYNSTTSDKSVTLTASYTYNGTTKSATKSISLAGAGLPAPTGLARTCHETKVELSWTASSGASYYNVYRSTTNSFADASSISGWQTATTYADTSAVTCVTYYYWVKAATSSSGANASAASSSVSGYRLSISPWLITASENRLNEIFVTWNDSAEGNYYLVRRGTTSSCDDSIYLSGCLAPGTTEFHDTTAAVGTTYYYWVVATINSDGTNGAVRKGAYAQGKRAEPIGLDTALDNPALTWTTGGDAVWLGQVAETHDGVDAAQSGAIGNSQASYLETTVNGGGTIEFWWKVSSEGKYDKLSFSIDGTIVESISGEQDWAQITKAITTNGTHVLRWTYSKDISQAHGFDCGWVDQPAWTPYSIALSPATQDLAPNAANGSIRVTSNTSWTVSKNVSWITLGTTSGNGNGTIAYSVAANHSASSRVGTITVSANGCDSKTHAITQKGLSMETIQILGDSFCIGYDEIAEYSCVAHWNDGTTSRLEPRWSICSNGSGDFPKDGSLGHYDVVIETNGSFKNEFIDAWDKDGILYVHNINATSEDAAWITPVQASHLQNNQELRTSGDSPLTLYRGEEDTEEVELHCGWNLITLLRHLNMDSKQDLIARNAFRYDVTSKSYVRATTDSIQPGVPLWIYDDGMRPEARRLSVCGVKVPSGFRIERKPGWNLVEINTPIMVPGWEWTSPLYRQVDTLEAGKAYWILEDSANTH